MLGGGLQTGKAEKCHITPLWLQHSALSSTTLTISQTITISRLLCCQLRFSQVPKHCRNTHSSHGVQLVDIKLWPAGGSFIFFLVLQRGEKKVKQREWIRRNGIKFSCPSKPTTCEDALCSYLNLYQYKLHFLHSELTTDSSRYRNIT